jgi:hypothetical protein
MDTLLAYSVSPAICSSDHMTRHARFHGRRHAQRLVNPAEVLMSG